MTVTCPCSMLLFPCVNPCPRCLMVRDAMKVIANHGLQLSPQARCQCTFGLRIVPLSRCRLLSWGDILVPPTCYNDTMKKQNAYHLIKSETVWSPKSRSTFLYMYFKPTGAGRSSMFKIMTRKLTQDEAFVDASNSMEEAWLIYDTTRETLAE